MRHLKQSVLILSQTQFFWRILMLRKYSIYFFAITIILLGSLATFAQSAPVRGKVELKKADGSMEPVANALVEVYRIDIKAKLPSAKTDKKGQFVFAGLPLGANITLAVSGTGIKPEIHPGVKAGAEDITITVSAGDGSVLTEDQVRNAVATTPKQGGGEPAQETAEQKKAREEAQKKYDEALEKNKKIEESNTIIKRSLEEGTKAFQEKNYDLAISKFDEGVNADPDFPGTATVLNNNKALALRLRGFEDYRQGVADKPNLASWLEKAKNDFQGSVAASQRTLDLIGKIADSVEAKKFDKAKYDALANSVEARRLMIATNADSSQPKEAITALEQYLAVETDPALKIKNQIWVGNAVRLSGNTALAIPIYRGVLEADPNNFDAMGYLGLCLFAEGAGASNKEQMQEGLNFMQRFSETATDKPGDKDYAEFKQSVAEAVKYLKEQEKLIPQKGKTTTTTTPAKGKKP